MVKLSNSYASPIRNGKWKEFNKRGVLIAEGMYVNNRKHGKWQEYYDHTGSVMIEEHYDHGMQHGRYASYHPNGTLLSEGEYIHGLREGYFKVYDEIGNHTRKLLFVHNIQIEDTAKTEVKNTGEREVQRGI